MDETIRSILEVHGRLTVDAIALGDTENLFRAGMTSYANVNVMLALEDAFGIEFPDDMLRRETFASIAAIRSALTELSSVGARP